MKLRATLLLRGAVVPAAFVVAVVVLGGWLFRRSLLASLDEALRAQATVEAVSMFDQGVPHLHVADERLFTSTTHPASRAIFEAAGRRVIAAPGPVEVIEALPDGALERMPWTRTRRTASGEELRELFVRVVAPNGAIYVLWVAQSLAPIDATVSTYFRTVGGLGLLAVLVLLAQQAWFASRLAERILRLGEHMARLMSGDLSSRPPPDAGDDELATLRASIAAATEKLEDARRSQDRLIADAAHELRTPLAALRANIDVTLRRERTPAELRAAFEDLREEVDRLGALATQLLELARGRHVEWRTSPVRITPLLREAIDARRGAAEAKSIEVALEASEDAIVPCDGDGMRQVFDNLLANAIDLAPASSRISVRAAVADDAWSVVFEDEGPGVPEDEREAIFRPFCRLDNGGSRSAGAGLGLTIVRDIVERHGGRVGVADGAVGAAFTVSLPVRAQSPRDHSTAGS